MPWELLLSDSRYEQRSLKVVEGVTRFLLDKNVDADVMLRFLDGRGLSAQPLPSWLYNRPDDQVLGEAWKQDRVLLTHDVGFLDMKLYPPEANPGVLVMPGGSGNIERHLRTIGLMLDLMKPYRLLWLHTFTSRTAVW